jgi:hypothetical protein
MLNFVDFPCYSNRGHDAMNEEWWRGGIASHRVLEEIVWINEHCGGKHGI